MREKNRIRFQWPVYRSVVEEAYPNPSTYGKARQIENLPGPREVCIADWADSEFGTSEQMTIDVPTHEFNQSWENCSAEELERFNTTELLPSYSRKARARKRGSLPRGVLIRAMYLALAEFRAGPRGNIVPLDENCSPLAIRTTAFVETRALRVQVRRRLWCFETPVSADGEIVVRRVNKSSYDRASLPLDPPLRQDGREHDLH